MLNILKTLTHHLLQAEEREEESCDIPDESLVDWREQVADELQWLQQRPDKHRQRIEQLQEITAQAQMRFGRPGCLNTG